MKSELMALFGDQLRWFMQLSCKQRLCVLYFCLSFGILLSLVFEHPLMELCPRAKLRGLSTTGKEAYPFE